MSKVDISAPRDVTPQRAADLASPGLGDVGGNNGKTVNGAGPATPGPTLSRQSAIGNARQFGK